MGYMVPTLLLFFGGFFILIKGADLLVRGASDIARRFGISSFVIGLVIVGIGTSIPEFAISFIANLSGEGDMGIGTIVGSNTFNILFLLGAAALFSPLVFKQEWVDRDLLWNVLAVFVVAAFALPFGDGMISRPEGFFMLALFVFWLYIVIRRTNHTAEEVPKDIVFPISITLILAGLAGVIVGGKWVVDGAVVIAQELGMSEELVGLTIVGIGTSLPELAVTFVAAAKRQNALAIGNIVGSNIFDFLLILGLGAVVKPIVFSTELSFDVVVTMLSAAILYGFMYIQDRYVLKRWQGLFLIMLYVVYLVYVF
jgi:cation:H+ antiporter